MRKSSTSSLLRIFSLWGALSLSFLAHAQTTLQIDDNDMDNLWSLTSPNAGPGDWVGVGYAPPFEHPFRVISGTMFYLDTFCCDTLGVCACTPTTDGFNDWNRRIIAPADLAIDPAGLTPDLASPLVLDLDVPFTGAGATSTNPLTWVMTPDVWTLPAGTIFDSPGRIFYAVKYQNSDQWMRFAVDDDLLPAPNVGVGIHTSDDFTTRASIWSFGNVGMRVSVEPIFFLKASNTPVQDSLQLNDAQDVVVHSIRVGAGNGSTTVTSVRLTASGSGNDQTDIASVRLIADLDQDGAVDAGEPVLATGSYTADNGVLTLTTNRTLPLGTVEEWLVVYDLAAQASGGDTFSVSVAQSTDVSSNLGAPYISATTLGQGPLTGAQLSIAGRLQVSAGPATMAPQIVPSGQADLQTLQLRFFAENEPFSLSRIRVTAQGSLHDAAQISSVRLYLDFDSDGAPSAPDVLLGTGTFNADDGGLEFVFAPITVTENGTRDFIVVYNLGAGAPGGATFRALLASGADITAVGQASGPLPLVGPRALVGAPVIGNDGTIGGALTAALGPANPAAGTAQPGSQNVPMLQLQLSAAAEAAQLNTITFTGAGSGDEQQHISQVALYQDVNGNGQVDGTDQMIGLPQSFAQDNGIVTFALSAQSVPQNASRLYLLAYDFNNQPTGGETFSAQIQLNDQITAQGQLSGATLVPLGTFPLAGGQRTMLGGLSITLAPESPPSTNTQPGQLDIPVLALAAAAQGEDFQISSLTFSAAGSMLDDVGVVQVRLFQDQGTLGQRDAGEPLLGTSSFNNDDGTALITFSPPLALPAGQTGRWLLSYDLSLAPQPGQTFRAALNGPGAVVASGALSGPITPSGLPAIGSDHAIGGTLTLSAGPANPTGGSIQPGQTEVPMLQLSLRADLEPITVTQLRLTASGTGDDMQDVVGASLYVDTNNDGVLNPVGDIPLSGPVAFAANDGALLFNLAPRTIPVGAQERWLVIYDFAQSPSAGDTFSALIMNPTDVVATAPSGPLPSVQGAPISGGERTTLGSLAIARGPQNPAPAVVPKQARDVPVVQLQLSGLQESFTISAVTVRAAGSLDDAGDISSVSLLLDVDQDGLRSAADTVLAGPAGFNGDDGVLTFGGLSVPAAQGVPTQLLVVADLSGTALGGATFRVNLQPGDIVATGLGGRAVTPAGLPLSSETLTAGGALTVGLGLASPIAQIATPLTAQIPALQLRVSADTEATTLTGITLMASGSGDDAQGLTAVELYVDANADGMISAGEPSLGTGTFSQDNGAVSFALSRVVQVGPALHLLALVSLSGQPTGGDTFVLSLDPTLDVSISSASGAVSVAGAPVQGGTVTAGGGFEVALGPNNSAGAMVNQALQNVPVMQLELRSVNEACTVQSLTFRAAGGIDDSQDILQARLVYDANDNGLVDFSDTDLGTPSTFAVDDGLITFSGIARAIGQNASQRWLVVYDLAGTAANLETFSLRLEQNADVLVDCNVSGPLTPSGAPVQGSTFTVQEDGALTLTRGAQTPPPLFLPEGAVRAAVLQLRAQASVQDLTLDALTLTVSADQGAPADTVATLELFQDVNQDGQIDRNDTLLVAGAAPDAMGKVAFSALNLPVVVSESVFLLATVNVAAGATAGTGFSVGLVDNTEIAASSSFGAAVVTGAPIAGETMTVAGQLNVAVGRPAATSAVRNDAQDLVALDFVVSAFWEPFFLRSLTVTAEGTMQPSTTVGQLRLVSDENNDGVFDAADRVIVSGVTFPEGARRAVIAGLDESIAPSADRRFLVIVDLDGAAQIDQTLTLQIAANVDMIAEGQNVGLTNPIGAPIVGDTFSVGASLLLEIGDAPPEAQIVAADEMSVPALQFKATAFNEDVTLSRLTLTPTGSLDDSAAIAAVHLFLDANANGRQDPEDVEVAAPSRAAGDDGTITFAPLAEQLGRGAAQHYLVTVDLSGSGQAGQDVSLALGANSDVTAFGSLSGGIFAEGAPIQGPQISLVGALNVRVGSTSPLGIGVQPGATFGAIQLELFTRGEAITIDRLQIGLTGTANDAQVLSQARLFRDLNSDGIVTDADQELGQASAMADDGTLDFDALNFTINASDLERVVVQLELSPEAETGGTIRLGLPTNENIRATGSTSGGVQAVGAPLQGSAFTIVSARPEGPGAQPEEGCGCTSAPQPARSSPKGSLLLGSMLALACLLRRRSKRGA